MSLPIFFCDINFHEIAPALKLYFGNENFLTLTRDFEQNNAVLFVIHRARK